MGEASAVPENLYRYSDRCTTGAQELQDWVRTVLTPAIRAYEHGGGPCLEPVDHDVAVQVASAYYTDREVRAVGHAFQVAGGVVTGPYAVTRDDLPNGRRALARYFMPDSALDTALAHQSQVGAGAALANRMTGHRDPGNVRWITAQLARHADDAYFLAGFVNTVTPDQLAQLLGLRAPGAPAGNADLVVKALQSGTVTPQAAQNIVRVLDWVATGTPLTVDHYYISAGTQIAFLQALGRSPVASRNLLAMLPDDQLRQLMRGHERFDAGAPDHGQEYYEKLLGVLSAAQQTYRGDPDAMLAYMRRVAKAGYGMDLTHVPGSGALLLNFLRVGVTWSIQPPTDGLDKAGLRRYAVDQGGRVDDLLGRYVYLIMKSNVERDHGDALLRGLAEGALLNVLPWGRAVKTGFDLTDNFVIGGLQSLVTAEVADDHFKDAMQQHGLGPLEDDNGKLNVLPFIEAVAVKSGALVMFRQLAAHGYLTDGHGNPVMLASDPARNRALAEDLRRSLGDFAVPGADETGRDYLDHYMRHLGLGGTSLTIGALNPNNDPGDDPGGGNLSPYQP